jgi:hypothetical protein
MTRRFIPQSTNHMITKTHSRSTAMNLIHEALSRARMRSPQTANSEARRSARGIAIQARHRQAREAGDLSRDIGVR